MPWATIIIQRSNQENRMALEAFAKTSLYPLISRELAIQPMVGCRDGKCQVVGCIVSFQSAVFDRRLS